MKNNQLGRSSLMVSEVSLGCMSLHAADQKQVSGIIHRAFEEGINFFDTADLYDYGMNEKAVGEAVHGFRKQVVISSKVGNQWRDDRQSWDWKANKKYILKAIDATLNRLKTDYLDLYQLHGGTMDDPFDEIIDAFETLKKDGKIRAYGISSIRPNVIKTYAENSAIDAVMLQYNLIDRRPEEELLSYLAQREIGVLARGPIAKGLLINKPVSSYIQYTSSEVQHIIRNVMDFTKQTGLSHMATAINYILSQEAISTVVLGLRSAQQLNEFIQVKREFRKLTAGERKHLVQGARTLYYTEHR